MWGVKTPQEAKDIIEKQKSEANIENRNAKHQERNCKGHNCIKLKQSLDGETGQNKAQECSAGVAHENGCRILIVRQKTNTGTQQGRQNDTDAPLLYQNCNDQQGGRGNGADAAGKTVQAINEVDCVCNGHDPNDGNRDGQPAQIKIRHIAEHIGIGQELDAAAMIYGYTGCRNLNKEFW